MTNEVPFLPGLVKVECNASESESDNNHTRLVLELDDHLSDIPYYKFSKEEI